MQNNEINNACLLKSTLKNHYWSQNECFEVSDAHQGCNYLIKNTVKTIFWNIIVIL